MYNPVVDVVICDVDATTPLPWNSRGISYRYICNLPLNSKLVKANKNVFQISTNIKSKRSLFTAWERLRRNDYGKEEYEEDKIDGPLKSSKDNDLERNLSRDEEVVNLVTQLQ
ncbi:hypothetical protein RhiirA1_465818 [Rhizophagus irregularis]|uniref:Uncharacterized protein n=1 Tax=Rhizophagus irregularis TaxID=588596 RepID=A0A2N0RF64_9GLOM|nr:hypothetical protein RhiirA1_465818 [Rhizophagus irregularis]